MLSARVAQRRLGRRCYAHFRSTVSAHTLEAVADGLPLVVIGKATMFAVIQVACRGSSAESAGSPLERVRALVVSPNRAAGSAASGGPAILVRDSSKTGMDE